MPRSPWLRARPVVDWSAEDEDVDRYVPCSTLGHAQAAPSSTADRETRERGWTGGLRPTDRGRPYPPDATLPKHIRTPEERARLAKFRR